MAPLDAATFRRTVRTLAAIPETCLPGEGSTPFVVPSGWSPLAVDSAGRRDRAPARMPALPGSGEERSGERRPEGAALTKSMESLITRGVTRRTRTTKRSPCQPGSAPGGGPTHASRGAQPKLGAAPGARTLVAVAAARGS